MIDDDTGETYATPGGGAATMLGRVAVLSDGAARRAICRGCGRELGRWREGEIAPPLRCEACAPSRCAPAGEDRS